MLSLDKEPIKINLPSLSTRKKQIKPTNNTEEQLEPVYVRKKFNFSNQVRHFIQQNSQKYVNAEEQYQNNHVKKYSLNANPQTIRKYPSTQYRRKSKTQPESQFHPDSEKQFDLGQPLVPTNLSPIKYFDKRLHHKKHKKQSYNQMITKERRSLQQRYLKKSLKKDDRIVVKTYLNIQVQASNRAGKIKRKHNTQNYDSQIEQSVRNRNNQNLIKKMKMQSKRKVFFNNLEVQTQQQSQNHQQSSTLSSAIRIFNSQSLKKSQYFAQNQNHTSIREAYHAVKPYPQEALIAYFKKSQDKKSDWREIDPLNLITYFVKVMFSSPSIHASPEVSKKKKKLSFLQEHLNIEGLPPTHQKELQQFVNNYTAIRIDLSKLFTSNNFQIVRQQHSLYFGEIRQIKIHQQQQNTVKVKVGLGVQITTDKIYEGYWKNNMKNGSGIQLTKYGKYVGHFSNGKKNGSGQFFWENGEYYSGQWSSNMKHGSGYWKASNGDSYMGQWVNNKVEGYGVHKSHNGQSYQGQFKNFLKHKNGIQTFPNGDRYEGQYWQGYAHGQGKYQWADKFEYQGQFSQGFRTGKGKIIQLTGEMEGQIIYQGQFNRQKAQGQGYLAKANGDTYLGMFKNSVFHGRGVYKALKEKKVYDGEWQEGLFVEGN